MGTNRCEPLCSRGCVLSTYGMPRRASRCRASPKIESMAAHGHGSARVWPNPEAAFRQAPHHHRNLCFDGTVKMRGEALVLGRRSGAAVASRWRRRVRLADVAGTWRPQQATIAAPADRPADSLSRQVQSQHCRSLHRRSIGGATRSCGRLWPQYSTSNKGRSVAGTGAAQSAFDLRRCDCQWQLRAVLKLLLGRGADGRPFTLGRPLVFSGAAAAAVAGSGHCRLTSCGGYVLELLPDRMAWRLLWTVTTARTAGALRVPVA